MNEVFFTRFVKAHADSVVRFQLLAQIALCSQDSRPESIEEAVRQHRYALDECIKNKEWELLLVCAYEALTFSALTYKALYVLLLAAFSSNEESLMRQHAATVCAWHAKGSIASPQLTAIFFEVIASHYCRGEAEAAIFCLRDVLNVYAPANNALLYTHLQAYLYAHTTDEAQRLIGKPDVFAR